MAALAYVLAFRVVMLAYTGRKRNALVIMAIPLMGGVLIAEWWAVLLSLVNGAFGLIFGVRRDLPRDPLSARALALFVAGEATLLAAGVGTGRLLRS